MTNAEQVVDTIINRLVVAKAVAVNTVAASGEYFDNSDMVKPANELLDRYKSEARTAILRLINEARVEEVKRITWPDVNNQNHFSHYLVNRIKQLSALPEATITTSKLWKE